MLDLAFDVGVSQASSGELIPVRLLDIVFDVDFRGGPNPSRLWNDWWKTSNRRAKADDAICLVSMGRSILYVVFKPDDIGVLSLRYDYPTGRKFSSLTLQTEVMEPLGLYARGMRSYDLSVPGRLKALP